MGKICNKLKEENIGSIGIGAMIVFIAMVLVAGIAASVLIQTSTRLEMQALQTGQGTIAEVASGIKIEAIVGHNTSGKIDLMAIEVTPLAGSPDLDMSQSILEISDSDDKFLLRYSTSLTNISEVNGSLFEDTDGDAWAGCSGTEFSLIVLQDADRSCEEETPVINFGDHVVVAVDVGQVFSANISPRTGVFGMLIPEEGAPGIIGFTTPAAITEEVVELQ